MILIEEDMEGLKSIISRSLENLYHNDFRLIEIRGMEQSAAFRTMSYAK